MKLSPAFAILLLALTGCSGTRTLFESNVKFDGNKVGITNLNKQHPAIDTLFPTLNTLYYKEIENALASNGYAPAVVDELISYDHPDAENISAICRSMNLN